jgi:Ner family transcriptional regulator
MPKKTADADWSRKQILAALEMAGWKTMKALADNHGLHQNTLFGALCKPYPASEWRIANAIGVHPKVIWPSRYPEEGETPGRVPVGRQRRSRVGKSLPQSAAARTT